MMMFEEADVSLKYQWFTNLMRDPDEESFGGWNNQFREVKGIYIAKIDITQAQT